MLSFPPHLAEFWQACATSVPGVDASRFYEAFYFADNEALADSLAALVLSGSKRATATALWSFEAQGKRAPVPGDLSVVTNWAGAPQCVIETVAVDLVPLQPGHRRVRCQGGGGRWFAGVLARGARAVFQAGVRAAPTPIHRKHAAGV